jgi:hypothetical protein
MYGTPNRWIIKNKLKLKVNNFLIGIVQNKAEQIKNGKIKRGN